MAKGVKKIKWIGNSGALKENSLQDRILCIQPDHEAKFIVDEWYNETTEQEKKNNITWLWMDQKKVTTFKNTVKASGQPFGVTLTKKLCGSYAFYLEASLYGNHDKKERTGLHVYGKCDEKITAASWSKKENAVDSSEINYGHNLFIKLETEGLNGDTLAVELHYEPQVTLLPSLMNSMTPFAIQTIKAKCVDGNLITKKFTTMSCIAASGGRPKDLENFYIKVSDITGKYLTNSKGSDKIISFTIKNKKVVPEIETPKNTTVAKVGKVEADPTEKIEEVEVEKVQGILKAYFAKEEFSLETEEVDGQHEYKFKTEYTTVDKDKVAPIIKKIVDAQVKADKKYAKLDDIKNALTTGPYGVGSPVSFNLCKLSAKFIKINSAPLEEEIYVVAETFLLDGKEVLIKIKEKEALLYEADTDVTVLEAKEGGSDIMVLKAIAENGIAKVKIKLRPKADEDLKTWKDKLLRGKKDESYNYTFKNYTTITDENKKEFATIILNNAKEGKQGNTKIATGKTAFADDVEKGLVSQTYSLGATISFDTYKTLAENLWLAAECQGDTKKYEGEFLKKDGEYFVIGKGKCPRCEILTKEELKQIFTDASDTIINEIVKSFNDGAKKFEINTCLRKAHFFAQVLKEVGTNLKTKSPESMNYSADALKNGYWYSEGTNWINGDSITKKGGYYGNGTKKNLCNLSYFRDNNNIADLYGRKDLNSYKDKGIQSANEEMLANYAYANNFGNKTPESGDGSKYRGKGLIQITWKENYEKVYEKIKLFDPTVNIVTNPEKILTDTRYAVFSAMGFWQLKKINDSIKNETEDSVVDLVTFKVNPFDDSESKKIRKENYKNITKKIFKVDECDKNKTSTQSVDGQSEYYVYKTGIIKYIKGTEKNHAYYVEKEEGKFKLLYTLDENENGMVKIPDSGSGFGKYGTTDAGGTSGGETVGKGDRFLLPKTASAIFGIINEVNGEGWNVDLGDMSSENGSDPWQSGFDHHAGHGHNGNRKGLDCDFRYLNTSGKSYQGNNDSSDFDKDKNKTFFNLAYKYGFRKNYCANPEDIFGSTISGVSHDKGHKDHGHIGLTDINIDEVQSINVTKI